MNIFLVFLIGISLAMDTFSLSLCLGAFNINKKSSVIFMLLVAIFHFVLPLLGVFIGEYLADFMVLNPNKLLFAIFAFLAIEMFISLISTEEKQYIFSFFSLLIMAFSVSIDSLTVGIGLKNIVLIPLLGACIFSVLSFIFTFIGLLIGKYSYEKAGKYGCLIGFIIIFILAIIYFFK